ALVCRRWADYADDVLDRGGPSDHEQRGLWFSTTGTRTYLRGQGPTDELAALMAVLDRLEPPDPNDTPGGPRSTAQRRYDALVKLRGVDPDHTDRDPDHTINIVIDPQTLTGEEFNPHGRSDIPGTGPVTPSRVEQLLCDSWISRLIVGPDGEILDLG